MFDSLNYIFRLIGQKHFHTFEFENGTEWILKAVIVDFDASIPRIGLKNRSADYEDSRHNPRKDDDRDHSSSSIIRSAPCV